MSRLAAVFAVALLSWAPVAAVPALACTEDAECDNGDTCSIPDLCLAGSCVLGGGGDVNGDLICDAEFDPTIDVRLTRLTARVSNRPNHDHIVGSGDFVDSVVGAFTGNEGVAFRARDTLAAPGVGTPDDGFDVTVTFSPGECVIQHSGSLACVVATGPLAKSWAKFKPNRFAPEQMRFSFKITGLDLTRPFFGPVRVILTHGTTRHRLGSITDCKLVGKGIKCREF